MGIFDNAETVIINNKEVQSIITSDGGVLYEAIGDLTLSSNKSIMKLSESATLSATYRDAGSGETIIFKIYKDDWLVTTLTDTTDNTGTATVSYNSLGIGGLSIQAFTSDLSISSNIIQIDDLIKYDLGTLANHTDSIWDSLANMTRETDYSVITSTSAVNRYVEITGDIMIELDLMSDMTGGGTIMSIRKDSTTLKSIALNQCGLRSNTWGHVKLQIKDNKLTVIGGSITDEDITDFNYWTVRAAADYSTYFKNLKIYSIPASVDSIGLTADKSIIQSGETATLTATLTGSDVGGKTVSFVIKHNNVTVDTLTGTTDNNGVANVSYVGEGTGDLNIQADYNGMIQSEICVVEDCIRYSTNSYELTPNSALTQISDFAFANTGDWEVSWIHNMPSTSCRVALYPSTDSSKFLGIGVDGSGKERIYDNNTDSAYSNFSYNTDYLIIMKKQGNSISITSRNTFLRNSTNANILSAQNINIGVRNWGSGRGTIKNIKIKQL